MAYDYAKTEKVWTEIMYERQMGQHFKRLGFILIE